MLPSHLLLVFTFPGDGSIIFLITQAQVLITEPEHHLDVSLHSTRMPSVKESRNYFPFLFQFPLFQFLIGCNFYQPQPPVTPASFKSSLQLNTKAISLKHKSYHYPPA